MVTLINCIPAGLFTLWLQSLKTTDLFTQVKFVVSDCALIDDIM